MSRFRKKPLVVEATQWHKNGDHPNDYDDDLVDPVTQHVTAGWEQRATGGEGQVVRYFRPPHVKGNEGHGDGCGRTWHAHGFLNTGAFGRRVCPGDWIVRDPVTGELHPVRPDVFEAKYEPVGAGTSNLMAHAERELGNAGLAGDDGYDGMLVEAVLAHVRLFADQGHSGFSAPWTVGILEKLLRFEPLTPLTGADDEWIELDYGPDMAGQNVRCSHVFRRADGTAYDSEGRIFIDPDGTHYTGPGSRVDVEFPYTPTRVFQHRDADGNWIDAPDGDRR